MQEKEDISYGVVPFYKDGNEWKVLVVHQISYRGDDFWILPKGHAEAGETPVQAAVRELKEETGVTQVALDEDEKFSISYSFTHDGTRIKKEVVYFFGVCDSDFTQITQPEEIKEIRWVVLDEAQKLLSHQNSKDVLAKATEHLMRIEEI